METGKIEITKEDIHSNKGEQINSSILIQTWMKDIQWKETFQGGEKVHKSRMN